MCDFRLALALPLPAGIESRSRETGVAFARLYLCGIETAIAFAGRKWAFLVQLPGAEVPSVSTVAVQGRAVVLSVSCGPHPGAGFGGVADMPGATRGSGQAHRSQPGRSKSRVIARNEAPAPASCGGGRQHTECLEPRQCKRREGRKQCKRGEQTKRHMRRKQVKCCALTSSRASRGTRWFRAAGSRLAGRGGSLPRARGAR